MPENQNYTFTLSVSDKGYPKKPENPGYISFTRKTIDIETFASYVRDGRAFCYNFTSKQDGIIKQRDRHKDNFISTSAIFFDMDKMEQPMEDFVNNLPFKPSVSYTTYSNNKNGKYGYRLVYCLSKPVWGVNEFNMIYDSMADKLSLKGGKTANNGTCGFDRRSVNQMYYGSASNGEVITSNIIYDFNEFCPNGNFPIENKYNNKKRDTFDSQMEKEDTSLIGELKTLGRKVFLDKYDFMRRGYNESLHTALIPSLDGTYYLYPDNYQEVFYHWVDNKPVPWQIGEDRKKKLYITGQIMKYNKPDITFNQLLFNLVFECEHHYVNTDRKINDKVLIDTAKNVLNHDVELKPCKHPNFSVNKDYWIQRGCSLNQAKQYIAKKIRWGELAENYDPDLTINQNLEQLHANGIKVGKSTLYKFKKENFP